MSTIEVPYLPVKSFKGSDIWKKFKESGEESEELNAAASDNLLFLAKNGQSMEVALAIHGMGMEKYSELFENENISLETLLQLNDSDLQELGITDPNDRKIILKGLEIHQGEKKENVVSENHFDDLKIARNVLNQLLLIQNYCAYIELQMKKHKLTDYKIISWKQSACEYLKAFTKCAFTQSKILSSSLFDESHSDHLIGKILKVNNLTLPKHLQKKLKSSKKSKRSKIVKIMAVMGICSLLLISGKNLLKRL